MHYIFEHRRTWSDSWWAKSIEDGGLMRCSCTQNCLRSRVQLLTGRLRPSNLSRSSQDASRSPLVLTRSRTAMQWLPCTGQWFAVTLGEVVGWVQLGEMLHWCPAWTGIISCSLKYEYLSLNFYFPPQQCGFSVVNVSVWLKTYCTIKKSCYFPFNTTIPLYILLQCNIWLYYEIALQTTVRGKSAKFNVAVLSTWVNWLPNLWLNND